MKLREYKTLTNYYEQSSKPKIEKVQGYFIQIKNYKFFVYKEKKYGWCVVDPKVGMALSKHFKTMDDAIINAKELYDKWLLATKTRKYEVMKFDYERLANEDKKKKNWLQMTIFDYLE